MTSGTLVIWSLSRSDYGHVCYVQMGSAGYELQYELPMVCGTRRDWL